MKRVCTLRKVLRSLSKVLLEKLFYRSYISCGFLSPLSSYCFCDISSQEICYGIATLNICISQSFFINFIATFATRILTCWYTMG